MKNQGGTAGSTIDCSLRNHNKAIVFKLIITISVENSVENIVLIIKNNWLFEIKSVFHGHLSL